MARVVVAVSDTTFSVLVALIFVAIGAAIGALIYWVWRTRNPDYREEWRP